MSNGNEFVYDNHPSMFRNHPVGYLALLLMILVPIVALLVFRDQIREMGEFPPVALLVLTVIGLATLAYWFLQTRATRLRITGDLVHLEEGLLNKTHVDLSIHQIRAVRVQQKVTDRMLGVGTIEIYTTGDNPEFTVPGMPKPHSVREYVRGRSENAV